MTFPADMVAKRCWSARRAVHRILSTMRCLPAFRTKCTKPQMSSLIISDQRRRRSGASCGKRPAVIVLRPMRSWPSLPGVFVRGLSHSDAQKIVEKLMRVDATGHVEVTQEIQYKKDALFALISRDDNHWQAGPTVGNHSETGQFELDEQLCAFCHEKGTLVAELENSDGAGCICPACKKSTLAVVKKWMT